MEREVEREVEAEMESEVTGEVADVGSLTDRRPVDVGRTEVTAA